MAKSFFSSHLPLAVPWLVVAQASCLEARQARPLAQLLAQVPLGGGLTLLAPVLLASCAFYLALSRSLGLLMTVLMLLTGWLDVSASFQLVAERLTERWQVLCPDWRGFGLSEWNPQGYWFQDYVGDLDAILAKALEPDALRRYRSVEAFGEDLQKAREHRPISARHIGPVTLALPEDVQAVFVPVVAHRVAATIATDPVTPLLERLLPRQANYCADLLAKTRDSQ